MTWTTWQKIRRRVQVTKTLSFEYEVSPHRRILATIGGNDASIIANSGTQERTSAPRGTITDTFIPFKQVRLQGQVNPLRPPIHVETVLIGRALGQPTGYRSGIGFRIRDDGYVEAEFAEGVRKYTSLADFELDIASSGKPSEAD